MALWRREGRHWVAVRALPAYSPPRFLRIAPARAGPPWWLSWTVGPDYGADALVELLQALLRATTALPTPPHLRRVMGQRLDPLEELPAFSPQAVRQPGLLMQRVELHPGHWLLFLYLTRAEGLVLVPEVEKYLVKGWWASLAALTRACTGGRG